MAFARSLPFARSRLRRNRLARLPANVLIANHEIHEAKKSRGNFVYLVYFVVKKVDKGQHFHLALVAVRCLKEQSLNFGRRVAHERTERIVGRLGGSAC